MFFLPQLMPSSNFQMATWLNRTKACVDQATMVDWCFCNVVPQFTSRAGYVSLMPDLDAYVLSTSCWLVLVAAVSLHNKCWFLTLNHAGILMELLQNADDAGATEMSFLLDCVQYPTNSIYGPSMTGKGVHGDTNDIMCLFDVSASWALSSISVLVIEFKHHHTNIGWIQCLSCSMQGVDAVIAAQKSEIIHMIISLCWSRTSHGWSPIAHYLGKRS